MRKNSPLTPYTRGALLSKVEKDKLAESLLAGLAIGEYPFIVRLVELSDCYRYPEEECVIAKQ